MTNAASRSIMGVKMSGETMQSFNNSSRRCAHASAIFSPPGFALLKLGVSREAMVFTTRYVRQWGAKAEHTVGLAERGPWCTSTAGVGRGPRWSQRGKHNVKGQAGLGC